MGSLSRTYLTETAHGRALSRVNSMSPSTLYPYLPTAPAHNPLPRGAPPSDFSSTCGREPRLETHPVWHNQDTWFTHARSKGGRRQETAIGTEQVSVCLSVLRGQRHSYCEPSATNSSPEWGSRAEAEPAKCFLLAPLCCQAGACACACVWACAWAAGGKDVCC